MTTHVLIVEDEPKLSSLLRDYVVHDGMRATVLDDGAAVLPWLDALTPATQPDLVLLDLMLPNKDGMSICAAIRQRSNLPIIMITARVEEIDRLLGLEIGADDYICKPFSPREVLARVRAVLRRARPAAQELTGLQLEADRLLVTLAGKHINLTAVEFGLLRVLVEANGRILSRSQLMDGIYSINHVVSDRTIDSHVKKLRKRLSELSDQEMIESVYGVGYRYLDQR